MVGLGIVVRAISEGFGKKPDDLSPPLAVTIELRRVEVDAIVKLALIAAIL